MLLSMFEGIAKTNTTHTISLGISQYNCLRVLLKQILPTHSLKKIPGTVRLRVLLKQILPTHFVTVDSTNPV